MTKRRLISMVIIFAMCAALMTSAFAAPNDEIAPEAQGDSTASVTEMDEEGFHYWETLQIALNYYGATIAVYDGVGYDILGAYDRYYIQRTGWRIYFGVIRP